MPEYIINPYKSYTKNPDTSLFKMHTHNEYEIFCFLSGSAKYFIEGTIYSLKPNDILIINKSEAHTLLIKSNTPYERNVVHFNAAALLSENPDNMLKFINEKPLGKFNHYPAALYDTGKLLYYLENMSSTSNVYDQRLYLTVFIKELSKINNRTQENDKHYFDNLTVIVEYINENISKSISLETIAEKFNLSKTHLNRKFKSIIGTTVWEYILTKRMIMARDMLNRGISPTNVFAKCGFCDYCSFYRNYKSKFGVSPKSDYKSNITE